MRQYRNHIQLKEESVGNERRIEMLSDILQNGTFLPKTVEYKDIDETFKKWVEEKLYITAEGKEVPTMVLYSNQRFSEYTQSWEFTDANKNLILNFKTVSRENNPQYGSIQNRLWNIPGERYYLMKRCKVLDDNGTESFLDLKMKQPMAIDLSYKVTIFCTKYQLINDFNILVNGLFDARQEYIWPNNHPMPMTLDGIQDESNYQIDDRQFYGQSYNIKVMAYIITEDDYRVEQIPLKKKLNNNSIFGIKRKAEVEIDEDSHELIIVFPSGCSVNDKVQIVCPIHGEFDQKPSNHLSGNGCPLCGIINNGTSEGENTFFEFIKSIYKGNIIRNDRTILIGQEIDILLPDTKIGFEYNGLYWHSELKKEKKYHINKTNECLKNGIQLIHIFEDEWINKKEICKSRIKNILKISDTKIYARKCEIRILTSKTKKDFLIKNHIDGDSISKYNYGLYYNNELVSVATFGERKISGSKQFELIRFANKINTVVNGGFSKLFQYFLKENNPDKIITYADIRWSGMDKEENVYFKNGFKYIGTTKPNYFYEDKKKYLLRLNRLNFTKQKLVKRGFSTELTETQIMLENGYDRIWDCGSMKFEYTK